MLRVLTIVFFGLLLFYGASAFAADQPPGEQEVKPIGGLSCFSLQAAKGGKMGDGTDRPSCDNLCGHKGAACTGVNTIEGFGGHGKMRCSDPPIPFRTECRCCAVYR